MLLTLIYFILVLGVIVLVHEFGHFFFSKLFKIYVYEFAIGMGPRIFKWKGKSETEYSIRAIPIGGFCSLAGEDMEYDDEQGVPKDKRLYAKPAWQRFLVMVMGAGNNFLLAIIILFTIGLCFGAPNDDAIVTELMKDYPAEQAGLKIGDKIIKVNDKKVNNSSDVSIYVQMQDHSKPVVLTIIRDGKEEKVEVKPISEIVENQEVYRIGVVSGGTVEHGFVPALKYSVTGLASLYRQMIITLKGLFGGGISVKQLSGPIGIFNIVGNTSKNGLSSVLYLIALLSVNVGFINLLPFPAFDGGRVLFLIIEKIKGSPVKPEVENKVHTVGFILLMLLMLYVTFNDITRLFNKKEYVLNTELELYTVDKKTIDENQVDYSKIITGIIDNDKEDIKKYYNDVYGIKDKEISYKLESSNNFNTKYRVEFLCQELSQDQCKQVFERIISRMSNVLETDYNLTIDSGEYKFSDKK